MRNVFISKLLEAAKKDSRIFLVTGDLGFGVLEEFESSLPKQFINAGVAEQGMVSLAAGLASTGKRVFVYSIGNFNTLRALEQIRNDVCYMNNSVVIVSVGAGYAYGPQGYTHHALEDISVMRALPNISLYSPADEWEVVQVMEELLYLNSPAYLRLGRSPEVPLTKTSDSLPPGKFRKVRDGNKGTILFTGAVGNLALELANQLINSLAIYSVPYISSLDIACLRTLASKGPIITLEEHTLRGGFGSAILESIALNNIDADVAIFGANQSRLDAIGDQEYLRGVNGLDVKTIINELTSLGIT
jgi:transketolase